MARIRVCSFAVVLFSIALGACAAGKPYQGPFNIPSLELQAGGDITQNGVTIGVAPLTRTTAPNYPIAKTVQWRQLDPGDPNANPRPIAQTTTRSTTVYLIPLPSFYVGIKNQTGAPLDLSQAQFEVVDNQERRYAIFRNGADLKSRFFADTTNSDPYVAGNRAMVEGMMNTIDQVVLPSATTVIPDGQQWQGYLVLNSDAHGAREYYALMRSIQRFTVRIKDVPTRGGHRSEFTFVLDKSERSVSLKCPEEISEPDPDRCLVNAPPATAGGRS